MAFEFKLPDIGEGVAEGEIVKWFVAEGDTVRQDQPMVEVLTDKANVEIPAPRAGTILKILAREGETVPVETTLVIIGDPGESVGDGRPAEAQEKGTQPHREPAHASGETAPTTARASGETGPARDQDRAAGRRPRGRGADSTTSLGADAGASGTQAARAPRGARAGVREQPKAPSGPVRQVEQEEAAARRDGGTGRGEGRDDAAGMTLPQAGDRKPRRVSAKDRILAMPGVRKFAREQGVDLSQVEASGSQGHILREDVDRFVAEGRRRLEREDAGARRDAMPSEEEELIGAAGSAPADKVIPLRRVTVPLVRPRRRPDEPDEELLPYRGVRRQIGRRMAQSAFTAPHYTYVEEVDADALVRLRREAQPLAEERGVKLTYLPFIVKALVPCLRAFPLLNAVLDEEAQQIRLKKRYNIGIATASEEGLIVPVLKDVDELSILEIAGEIRRLSEAARDRSIKIEELRGSTFTITSLGPLGGLLATPIINFPEVAILGVHAIKQKPVVRDGSVVPGSVMNVSLSFDHRVVDGAIGAEFTRMLVRYLENPQLLLLES
jgi:pyruvate dehydrogenase E2 component (dihydrolipoamide acetyltransferase)